jgi:hypothetical protein
VNGKRLRLSIQ